MNILHCKKRKIHAMFHSTGKNNHCVMETMATEDSISLFLPGAVNLFPLVQFSSLNQVNSLNSSSIRFWISILDGFHKHELLLPVIYSDLVENGQLKEEGTIIKITQCTCNIVYNVTYVQFPHCFFLTLSIWHCSSIHCFSLPLNSNILHLTGLSHCLHSKLS